MLASRPWAPESVEGPAAPCAFQHLRLKRSPPTGPMPQGNVRDIRRSESKREIARRSGENAVAQPS
jgi:hypothetical protein